jgi:hypothetical protein
MSVHLKGNCVTEDVLKVLLEIEEGSAFSIKNKSCFIGSCIFWRPKGLPLDVGDKWFERDKCWIEGRYQPHTFIFTPGVSGEWVDGMCVSVSCDGWKRVALKEVVTEKKGGGEDEDFKIKTTEYSATILLPPGKSIHSCIIQYCMS